MTPPVRPEQDQEGQRPDAAAIEAWRARMREAEAQDEAAATAVSEGGTDSREPTGQDQNDPDKRFFGFKDTMRGIFNGVVVNTFNELTDFTNSATQWAAKKYLDLPERQTGRIGRGVAAMFAQETEPLQLPKTFGETNTTVGQFGEVLAQFATGLVGTGKFITAGKAGTRLAQFGNLTARGAVVDFTLFDPYADTLAEIGEQIGPEFTRTLSSYIASDEDDNEAERRFKNAIEGAALGGVMDTFLFLGGRIIRNTKWMKDIQLRKSNKLKADAPEPPEQVFDYRDQPAYDRQDPNDIILPQPEGVTSPQQAAARLADDKTARVTEKGPLRGKHPMDEATYARRARQVAEDAEALEAAVKQTDEAVGEATERFGNRGDAMAHDASIKAAQSASGAGRHGLSDEVLVQVKEMADMIGDETDPDAIQGILDAADFNFGYVESTKDAKNIIAALSEVLGKPFESRRLGQETWEIAARLGDDMFQGATGAEAAQLIAATTGATDRLPAIIAGARKYLHTQGKRVAKLSRRFDLDPDDAEAADQLAEGIQHLFDVAQDLAGASSNIGRALNIHKLKVGAETFTDSAGREVNTVAGETLHALTGLSKKEIHQLGRMLRLVDGDPSKVIGLTRAHRSRAAGRASKTPGYLDKFVELMMNSMLSSPKTQIVNIVTTAVASAMRPTEMMLGGVLTNNPALRQQGWDTLVGLGVSFGESWKAANKALRLGRNVLDPESMIDDRAIAEVGAIGGWAGKILRLPSRFLLTGDELLKQMNYRADIRSRSLKLARQDGIMDPAEIAKRMDDDMRMSFDAEGAARNQDAMQYSRNQTFTNDLEYGWGKSFQKLGRNHPMFRIMCMPFVRTPANLLRWTWRHTPALGMLNREMKAAWKAGGEERAMAIAQQSTGLMIYGTAALMAHNKTITGRGPGDPALRELWLQHHQPYSIQLPDGKWLSYRRGDPILTPMGVIADGVTAWGENDDDQMTRWASTMIAALAANVTNKTFLQGVTEAFDMISSGRPQDVERFMKNRALTMVPFSAATRAVTSGVDPVWREVETLTDNLWKTTPGMSQTLPPSRNIFGEPILRPAGFLNNAMNPFTVSDPLDDDVLETVIELGRGMGMPAEEQHGVNLRDRNEWGFEGQSPYDRMLQLLGESEGGKGRTKMPKQTLRDAVTNVVRSEAFRRASSGTSAQPGGLQYDMVVQVVNGYQDAAMAVMLSEPGYQRVQDAITLGMVTEAAGKVGGDEGAAKAEEDFLRNLNR